MIPDGDTKKKQQRYQRLARLPHYQFQIAPIDAVGIEADTALYKTYGCDNGIFISKMLETSVFKVNAKPPLEEKCFLTAVDGVPLDEFGMGRTNTFLHDPIPFESLLMMKVRPGDTVKVKTCSMDGDKKEREHTISMEWKPDKYVGGIRNIVEPFWDPESQSYEIFSGITIMEMTVNHIINLLRAGQPPTLGRWLLPENMQKKQLIITHVQPGGYASRVVSPGMVISKVNGHEIGTLEEYRKIFIPPDNETVWRLETDRGVYFATNFREALEQQFQEAQMGLTYMFCQSVVDAVKKMMANAPTDSASGASLAQTLNTSGRVFVLSETANFANAPPQERVTRLARRQALSMGQGSGISEEDVRRRLRASGSGFLTLASSEYVPDHGLKFGLTAP
jgi:hypothetical protein